MSVFVSHHAGTSMPHNALEYIMFLPFTVLLTVLTCPASHLYIATWRRFPKWGRRLIGPTKGVGLGQLAAVPALFIPWPRSPGGQDADCPGDHYRNASCSLR